MPPKKYGLKRVRRRGRPNRKGYLARRRLQKFGHKVHYFEEYYNDVGIHIPGATASGGIITAQFNNLGNSPSMRQLFDLYKITKMKVKMVPSWNTADIANTGTGHRLPMLYYAPNRDPYVPAPTDITDIMNDDGVKVVPLDKPHQITIYNPKPDILGKDGSSLPFQFNAGLSMLQPWLTTGGNAQLVDQSAIKHYGVRWFLDAGNTIADPNIDIAVYIKLYVQLKEQD